MLAAEDAKILGNEAFAFKKYDDAIAFYTKAIELNPDCAIYYSNRSASQALKLNWKDALEDATTCIAKDPSFGKGYLRLGSAQIALGNVTEAESALKDAERFFPDNPITHDLRDEVNKAKRRNLVLMKSLRGENAGRGVFANKSFKQGQYVCFYDGKDVEFSKLKKSNFTYSIAHLRKKGYVRLGFPEPKSEDGVGQLINDFCAFELNDTHRFGVFKIFTITNTAPLIEEYNTRSVNNQNVVMNDDFRLVATRDIMAGEELCFHYGIDYWLTKLLHETDEPFTRLYCMLLLKYIQYFESKYWLNGIPCDPTFILHSISIIPNGDIMQYLNLVGKSPAEQLKALIRIVS
jgi:tetratricopeptide (TPR) repeat protein